LILYIWIIMDKYSGIVKRIGSKRRATVDGSGHEVIKMARMESEATIAILRQSEADLIARNLMLSNQIEDLQAKIKPKFDHTKVINRSLLFEDFFPVSEFMEKFNIVHKEPNQTNKNYRPLAGKELRRNCYFLEPNKKMNVWISLDMLIEFHKYPANKGKNVINRGLSRNYWREGFWNFFVWTGKFGEGEGLGVFS